MSGSRLTIRHHVTSLVAISALGGLLLASLLVYGYRSLDKRGRELDENTQTLLELSFLREGVAAWLVSVDTLFVETEVASGALVDSTLVVGNHLLFRCDRLASAEFLQANQTTFGQLRDQIGQINAALNPISTGELRVGTQAGREAQRRIDAAANGIPELFTQLEDDVTVEHSKESAAILRDRAVLIDMTWLGGVAFLVVVLLTWRWTTVRLVRPLQTLTESTRRALKSGDRIQGDPHGPREVHQLSTSFTSLVASLKQARDSVRSRAAETEALLQSIPAVMIGVDPQGKIALWNAEATRSFGLIPKQALGRELSEVPIPWEGGIVPAELKVAVEDRSAALLPEVKFVDTKGCNRLLSVTTTPVAYGAGSTGSLILGSDMTEQRSLEAQVRHSQKLESVGQLAAGIAHEINTPIQYVGHSVHFLQEAFDDMGAVLVDYKKLKDCVNEVEGAATLLENIERSEEQADLELLEEEVPGAIDRAIEGVNRVATIVGAMKRFAHPGASELAPTDINEAVRTTLTVANNEVRYVADVQLHLGNIPAVECDLGDINQVLLNLIVNAAHAIEERVKGTDEKGTITIRTRSLGDRISLEVSDTGMGIPADVAENIYDPFFTTKEVGKGTGQGLAIAHNIIREKHSGELSFETRAGVGTTFKIILPVRQKVLNG